MKRILVTRTDRLGDVILATPVLRRLIRSCPEAKIDFLVRKEWVPVLRFPEPVRTVIYDPNLPVGVLAAKFRAEKYDAAYVLRDDSPVTKAVYRAGIPFRVGPYSSLRSFFRFNKGLLQRRSRCLKHEAGYNLDLAGRLPGGLPVQDEDSPRAWIETSEEAKHLAGRFLSNHGLLPGTFLVIHPGSSGSARYVKQGALQALARALLRKGTPVVVSGGPAEEALIEAFRGEAPGVTLLGSGAGIGLDGLAEVMRQARSVIAHGTGPLHLAAAVGTPVLAIFPPLFVLSERRWGPLVQPRSVWVPEVTCPEKFRCAGPKCPVYDCMDLFDTDSALRTLENLHR
jgi:ADP-heptose:LPS heptosyltransferase